MGCRICGQKLDVSGTENTLFKHYLREHPLEAAKTWRCCIPRALKQIPEVRAVRLAKGWDAD